MSKRKSKKKITRVTLENVAERAGVSRGAVSDIVNRGLASKYTAETQALVLKVINEMGYRPTRSAQNLSRGRSDTVGVLFPSDLENIFLARLFHHISESLWDASLSPDLMLMPRAGDADIVTAIDRLISRGVDGLLIGPLYAEDTPILNQLQAYGAPRVPSLVFGGRDAKLDGYHEISLQDHISGKLAVDYLISLGHRSVGFLGTIPIKNMPDRASFQAGTQLALADAQVLREEWFLPIDQHDNHLSCLEGARRFGDKWLMSDSGDKPTALVCKSDQIAMAALAVFNGMGIRVPKDLSVIGYDNLPEGLLTIPALTTVDNALAGRVRRIVAAINDAIMGEKTHKFNIESNLTPDSGPRVIERDSVAPTNYQH